MFEINDNIKIKKELVDNSIIYIIDNFYKNPDEILNLFLTKKPIFFKGNKPPSLNGVYFEDRRHIFNSSEITHVYNFLGRLCNQKVKLPDDLVLTNCVKFYKVDFNDYQNNYWWPHYDKGYTGIVYFNRVDFECGTNLYKIINFKDCKKLLKPNEHVEPWKSKKYFNVIKLLKPNFNRLILFDGKKFLHGMNICNDRYFGDEFRINQPFFFGKENNFKYQ